MSQILHIFRKDVRHHWVVILLCQVALILYCWEQVSDWNDPVYYTASAVAELIGLVLPLTWCFFILRTVQEESLAGDRQFWVTRPYEWKKLLAEKILLVALFLNLPLLIAGVFLMAKAGFSPLAFVPGLLWMQLLLFLVPFLPLLALAVVTRNLVPAMITLLAVLLSITVVLSLTLMVGSRAHFAVGFMGVNVSLPHISFDLPGLVLMLVCVVAILLQYARRKTAQSRLWLAGGIAVAVAISVLSGYARRNRDPFPGPVKQTTAFHAAFNPVKLIPPKRDVEKDESVPIGIPMMASGVPEDSLGVVRGIRLILEAPDGFRWDGRWPGSNQLLVPGDNRWRAMFEMDYDAYQHMKSTPLKAFVSMSVELLRESDFEEVTVTAGQFDVPGVGRCRLWRRDRSTLRCNSPLLWPPMVVARFRPDLSTCPIEDIPPVAPPKPLKGLPYAWQRGRRSSLPEGGISPVATSLFYFWDFSDKVSVCPGTPLEFSFPQFVENVRNDFEIDNLNLDDYRKIDYSAEPITGPDGIRLGLPSAPRR